ncbi:MAG TPA: PilT/PilU family type 4a pilus ATPase [Vicinamibacterales bacterium]|jgi:twitching motility protein PilT|nr:PilT/PilU family type 4a pilus ATPase [Vicinamibacterales bacterium]
MTNDDEIDRLILELHSTGTQAPSTGDLARIERWLRLLASRNGSDLLLVAGAPPSIRVDGRVLPLAEGPLDGVDIEDAVMPALPPHARRIYRDAHIVDASFRLSGVGRFRINLHRERGRAAAAIRLLPTRVPRLATLGLPPSVELLGQLPRGLVLIGGPTGSGKTTTLAALVDDINRRAARHVVTIEDPIEYEHVHQGSVIEQVEIGVDAPDFPTALRAAVRQAPDVIVVGEMRDPETMRIALASAETGHLVLSTLHTTDVASTVSRIADSFPSERQNTIRQELSMALAAVMTQTLLPKQGGGLVPAAELLMVSYGARQHVRRNALQHLHQEITITRRHGSFTFEESLARLVKDGLVEWREAHARAAHADEFEQLVGSVPPSHP